jgi:glutamyl-tRNA reductase
VIAQLPGQSKIQLMLVGTNHKHAPIELRERLSCQTEQLPLRLRALVNGHRGINEAVLLSTCNRTEVYIAMESDTSREGAQRSSSPVLSAGSVQDYVIQRMAEWAKISPATMKGLVYCLTDENAVRHLFHVASGLDSMVIGEQQIRGQVHDAAKIAAKTGTAGRLLMELFQHACHLAEDVERKCDLDFADVSVSSASISLIAKEASADRPISSMLLVGAGKMIKLAASNLSSLGLRQIWVANRTEARAEELATRMGGSVLPFNRVQEVLERADAILTCTSSQDYVIKYDDLQSAVRKRNGKPIIIVDASVPRNVDPTAAKIPGVNLYNIDDLAPFVQDSGKGAEPQIEHAKRMIESEVEDSYARIKAYDADDTLKNLRKIAEEIREKELSRALRKLGKVTDKEKVIVDLLTRRIVNKLLYEPTARLKEHVGRGNGEIYDEAIRELFGISQESER